MKKVTSQIKTTLIRRQPQKLGRSQKFRHIKTTKKIKISPKVMTTLKRKMTSYTGRSVQVLVDQILVRPIIGF